MTMDSDERLEPKKKKKMGGRKLITGIKPHKCSEIHPLKGEEETMSTGEGEISTRKRF
jgi:hypothetical protein